jgi:hypothetical protein
MSRPFLTLLAARARLVAIVAGTALTTAAVVGGGTVAVQSVATVSPEPAPVAEKAQGAKHGQGAEKRGLAKLAKLQRANQAPAVPFVCDPSKTHGQNISAYVHSLPTGPGRGALVSQAAKSDCGKPADGAAEPAKDATANAEKPGKPEGVGRPEKPAKPGKVAEPGPAGPKKATKPGSAPSGSTGPQGSAAPKSAPPESAPPGGTTKP